MAADGDHTLGGVDMPSVAGKWPVKIDRACVWVPLEHALPSAQPCPFRDLDCFRQPDRVDTRAVEQT